jgi:hypothetical protein
MNPIWAVRLSIMFKGVAMTLSPQCSIRCRAGWSRFFAVRGAENEIDRGASQSLELGIAFMLTDSCQAAVEDVSRQ